VSKALVPPLARASDKACDHRRRSEETALKRLKFGLGLLSPDEALFPTVKGRLLVPNNEEPTLGRPLQKPAHFKCYKQRSNNV
jgi:hypothetical protein